MRDISKKQVFLLVLVVIAGLAGYLYSRPVPSVSPISHIVTPPKTTAISLPWPAAGQAALGAEGYGLLESHNAAYPQSIASIAKVITALAVLEKKPLALGSQGPSITLDSTDTGYLSYYSTHDGSVVKVVEGEHISEYQALQAMLIASANNVADSLARWAFGSTADYIAYANKMAAGMGLTRTTVGNTNGFDDTTTSTADDLVNLGLKALQNPVIADIVSQPTAVIPIAGQIKNVNWLLGSNGVEGIKTGNTDKAGGCYLFAAKRQISGKTITMVGAVLGAPDLAAAISAAPPLLNTSDKGFQQIVVVHKGQLLAEYNPPWGGSAQLKAGKDLSLLVWKGKDIKVLNNLEPAEVPAAAGSLVGTVGVESSGQSAESSLYLSDNLNAPSWNWRIFRK